MTDAELVGTAETAANTNKGALRMEAVAALYNEARRARAEAKDLEAQLAESREHVTRLQELVGVLESDCADGTCDGCGRCVALLRDEAHEWPARSEVRAVLFRAADRLESGT
jgi:predicted PP-loop superfamily ATPase